MMRATGRRRQFLGPTTIERFLPSEIPYYAQAVCGVYVRGHGVTVSTEDLDSSGIGPIPVAPTASLRKRRTDEGAEL